MKKLLVLTAILFTLFSCNNDPLEIEEEVNPVYGKWDLQSITIGDEVYTDKYECFEFERSSEMNLQYTTDLILSFYPEIYLSVPIKRIFEISFQSDFEIGKTLIRRRQGCWGAGQDGGGNISSYDRNEQWYNTDHQVIIEEQLIEFNDLTIYDGNIPMTFYATYELDGDDILYITLDFEDQDFNDLYASAKFTRLQ